MDIDLDVEMLRPQGDRNRSRWHHAIETIRYDLVDPQAPPGLLIYLEPSLTGDEPADVLDYAGRHRDFPHESTADQFFDESQFESYRRLGLHVVHEIFSEPTPGLAAAGAKAFEDLRARWNV